MVGRSTEIVKCVKCKVSFCKIFKNTLHMIDEGILTMYFYLSFIFASPQKNGVYVALGIAETGVYEKTPVLPLLRRH